MQTHAVTSGGKATIAILDGFIQEESSKFCTTRRQYCEWITCSTDCRQELPIEELERYTKKASMMERIQAVFFVKRSATKEQWPNEG